MRRRRASGPPRTSFIVFVVLLVFIVAVALSVALTFVGRLF